MLSRLRLNSLGEACCLDHAQLVSADSDLLMLVVCLELKRDQWSVGVDHSRATNDLCSEGRRCRVLDTDNDTDGALAWLKQNSIARLDCAGLFRSPHMALHNKQNAWYVLVSMLIIPGFK